MKGIKSEQKKKNNAVAKRNEWFYSSWQHRAIGIYTEENLGASLSLRVLFRFLGVKPFSQFSPRPFFHVFHLFQNVCKRRRGRERDGERGRKAGKQRADGPLIRALPYKRFLSLTFCLNEFLFQGLRQVCFPFQSIVQGVPYL